MAKKKRLTREDLIGQLEVERDRVGIALRQRDDAETKEANTQIDLQSAQSALHRASTQLNRIQTATETMIAVKYPDVGLPSNGWSMQSHTPDKPEDEQLLMLRHIHQLAEY